MGIKWIFFDLDDTLYDFTSSSLKSLTQLWEEEESLRTKFDSAERFIDEYHIHNAKMWELHESGKITSEFLKAERFRLTLAPERNDEEIIKTSRRLNDRYLQLLGQSNLSREGAMRTLKNLSAHCLIGVLTNGFNEVQYEKLRSTGLDRYIQRVVISDEIGVQKPSAELFRYAERETGATPETTLMVGDNPQNDIEGALNAGWHATYYNWKGKPFESSSELYHGEITKLEELTDLINF